MLKEKTIQSYKEFRMYNFFMMFLIDQSLTLYAKIIFIFFFTVNHKKVVTVSKEQTTFPVVDTVRKMSIN